MVFARRFSAFMKFRDFNIPCVIWLGILGSAIWAGIHMTLLGLTLPYIVKVFFGFVIAIAIVSAMIYVSDRKEFVYIYCEWVQITIIAL